MLGSSTLGGSELGGVTTSFTLSLSDSITISDVITKLISLIESEVLTITDVLTKSISETFAESIGLSESFMASYTLIDIVTLSDAIDVHLNVHTPLSLNDSISLTDSILVEMWSPNADQTVGDYDCDVCGFTYKKSTLLKRWDNALVCKWDYEPQHPRDFIHYNNKSYRSKTNGNI